MSKRPQAARTRKVRRVRAVSTAALALPAECTLAGAGEIKTSLARLLNAAKPVKLDASAVQRVDTASLQLIAAFIRDRRSNGFAVEWTDPSAAFARAAGLLGLTAVLGLPESAA